MVYYARIQFSIQLTLMAAAQDRYHHLQTEKEKNNGKQLYVCQVDGIGSSIMLGNSLLKPITSIRQLQEIII